MKTASSFLQTAANWTVLATVFLLATLVVPTTANFLFESKLFLFFASTAVMGVLYLIHTLQRKEAGIVFSRFTVPLFLFSLSMAASTFFTNDYPVESILGFGGMFIAGVLYVFFASRLVSKDIASKLLLVLGVTAAVLTVSAGAQLVGYGPANILNQLAGLQLPTTAQFSITGSPFVALQFLVITLVGFVVSAIYTRTISRPAAILAPIIVIGIALHTYSVLPGKPGAVVLPSATASWSVALDTIRAPRAALIGAGPASYSNLYLRFKPVWMNSTENWNIPFSQASNFPLTLLTTNGFLGLFTWALLFYSVIRAFASYENEEKAVAAMLIGTFVLQLFLPSNLVLIGIQLTLFVILIAAKRTSHNIVKVQALTVMADGQLPHEPARTKNLTFPVYVVDAVIAGFLLFSCYMLANFYSASNAVFAASKAAQENNAVAVYENQQRAIQLNPYLDAYRREYAATNLLIASSLANKADATDAEKAQVSELLQQAVREARSATVLDALDTQNWAVLAQIYQNMIGAVEQADQFTVQAYLTAIENDPTNPQLHLGLGGVFLAAKEYQQAASLFQQAVNVKPDFTNARFNLAFSLEQLGSLEGARNEYNALLGYLDQQTEDYTKISDEIKRLDAEIEKNKPAAAEGEEAATGTGTTQKKPSIIEQNLESSNDLITNPPADSVDLNAETKLSGETTPTATPAPEPTPAP